MRFEIWDRVGVAIVDLAAVLLDLNKNQKLQFISANRKKSKSNYSYLHVDDDDDEYYSSIANEPIDQRPGSSFGFRCLAVVERGSSSSSSATDFSKGAAGDTIFPDVAEDERKNLYRDLDNFLCADRYMTSKLTMANNPGRTEQTFTIGSRKEQHRYGDVLWLILRAYFSGREVTGGQDATFEVDAMVFAKREERSGILDEIMRYTAIPVNPERHDRLEMNYITHLQTTRKEVTDLLARYDKYQSLFPHSKAMEEDCSKRKGAIFKNQLLEKLGAVFEVSRVHEGEKHWPRPLRSTSWSVGLRDARPVFEAFVKRSLQVRMEMYSEMFSYTLTSEKATAIHLPSIGPMFIFVLGVRLELAREWLSVRAKLFFLDVIQSICPKGKKGKLCTYDFDATLKDVFEKYLGYVERWCDSVALSGDLGRLFSRIEEEWRTAFQCSLHIHSGLDMLASTFCSILPHLLNELVVKFWQQSMSNISDKHGLRESDEERSFEGSDNGYDSQTREQTTMFDAFRAYNSVIREARFVKERSGRLVALLRGALADLHDAAGYVMTQPLEDVLSALRPDHCMVDFGEECIAVCVFVDSASADKALAQDLITALAEGRIPDNGRLVVIPKPECRQVQSWQWNYRRVKLTLEENVLENIHYLRTDVVCAIGADCKLEKRYQGMFELVLPSCSSHYNVDRELRKLAVG
ncbi:unnamed protein product [Nippostrongylus brasiliensis]|uniref:Mitogen-activated protein kinase kinase kinase 4 (inferred by orthology to a human protein) n=1 Tax=Nippostrongylus brasiliensis TaxID=27835 RepID=A0A0N4YKS0_NIPBR|nr:unnamed protein product [Nippostrongylus brasiliensis]